MQRPARYLLVNFDCFLISNLPVLVVVRMIFGFEFLSNDLLHSSFLGIRQVIVAFFGYLELKLCLFNQRSVVARIVHEVLQRLKI